MYHPNPTPSPWSVQDSRRVYGIHRWGRGLFRINEKGEVAVSWDESDGRRIEVSLIDILEKAHQESIHAPLLIRFPKILQERLQVLNEGFAEAIEDLDYGNVYRGVFPVKVNQQHQVVRDIAEFGKRWHHGFEVGSKAELVAALGYLEDPESFLICNGYKDRAFVRLTLLARAAGHRVIPVVERPRELKVILEEADKLGIEPEVGMRVRLSTVGKGYWVESSGEQSLFGLSVVQIYEAVEFLRRENRLDCLKLLHFHQGSQLPDIQSIRESVTEAVHVYAGLVREGAPMGILNLGGGLAVDYDGSRTSETYSRNYEVDEYCHAIVDIVKRVTDEADVPAPVLMTESGRATAAHYSLLALNILDVNTPEHPAYPDLEIEDGWNENVSALAEMADSLDEDSSLLAIYHDATFRRDAIHQAFALGQVSLRERAATDQFFWHLLTLLRQRIAEANDVPDALREIEDRMADIYYGNFSVFQSLPDNWAIEQQFPVMPLHRLHEEPTRHALIADLTCDCDGKLDCFLGKKKSRRLPVHELREGEDYYFGVFLVGAYQETLSDMHNLFGDTHAISIDVVDDRVEMSRHVPADSVGEVLSFVEFDPARLVERVETVAQERAKEGRIAQETIEQFVADYRSAIEGYTYFDHTS